MNLQDFNELVERLVSTGFAQELADAIALRIGGIPEVNLDGDIVVEVNGDNHTVPWEIYDPTKG